MLDFCATPWTVARQAPLSLDFSTRMLKWIAVSFLIPSWGIELFFKIYSISWNKLMEKSIKRIYMYNWITLLYTRNLYNIVNRLYFNKKNSKGFNRCFFKADTCCCLVAKLCLTLLWPHGLSSTGLLCPWNFPGKNNGVGCHFLPWQVDSLPLILLGSLGLYSRPLLFICLYIVVCTC